MKKPVFYPADILIPKPETDLNKYSVVACDQYSSEPEYWSQVEAETEGAVSAYHMVFPEAYLEQGDFEGRIHSINTAMQDYLHAETFEEYPSCLFYVERTLRDGKVRRGIVGAVDLEQYSYEQGSVSAVRATEGTVLERIPPRVKIREHAALELPHVMLLLDDRKQQVIEPLAEKCSAFRKVYDFDLMDNSGHLTGYQMNAETQETILKHLDAMGTDESMRERYGRDDLPYILFAVGDGNHSLACAKACYEKLKQTLPPEQSAVHPARYALAELVNLHEKSLEFEPIHRVVFGVEPEHLKGQMMQALGLSAQDSGTGQAFTVLTGDGREMLHITKPTANLTVGSLQNFLDRYLKEFGGQVDYIHGQDVTERLCRESGDRMGFLLPPMEKDALFPTVMLDGALPRKTFSMGEAWDKRFYLEARKIR